MMLFNENKTKTPTIKVTGRPPVVAITTHALQQMRAYTEQCSDEIGWLGTVTYHPKENAYLIHECRLFEQEVHSATTEITAEGLSSFGEELLQQDDGMEVWNNLKMWGHSHVNMGTTPSGQDDDQMETFQDNDFFIRIITNKKGALRCDVYDFTTSIAYLDVAWFRHSTAEERQLQEQINALQDQLEHITEQDYPELEKAVTTEIKEKVSKIRYNYKPATTTIYPAQQNWAAYYADAYDEDEIQEGLFTAVSDVYDLLEEEDYKALRWKNKRQMQVYIETLAEKTYHGFILDKTDKDLIMSVCDAIKEEDKHAK